MKRKVLAVLLAVVTALSSVPVYASAPDGIRSQAENNRVMQLEFEGDVSDSIAAERQTCVKKWVNGESVTAVMGADYDFAKGITGEKALQLNGGAYLSLGTEADLNPSSMTFSLWINPQEKMEGEQILAWNKNEWNQDGWYLSTKDDESLIFSVGTRVFEVHLKENRETFIPADTWTHIAVTFDNETKQAAIYRNGVSQLVSTGISEDVIKDSGVDKALGYNGPAYKFSYLKAKLDHVVLQNEAADASEIADLYQEGWEGLTDNQIVAMDKEALNPFSSLDISAITSDVRLPIQGANGSTITWESSKEDVMSASGKVVRPDVDTEVTLTAVIVSGEAAGTKTFTVTVKGKSQLTKEKQLWVSYDMTVEDGVLKDSQGRCDAKLVGLSASDVVTAENGERQLVFADNADRSKYVKLPQEMIEQGDESFTVDMKFNTSQMAFAWVFNLGTKNTTDYVFLNPIRAWGPTVLAIKSSVVSGDEHVIDLGGAIQPGEDTVATMVFDEDGTAQLYLNGKLAGSVNHGCKITDILERGVTDPADAIGYLGLSVYGGDPGYEGTISRFDVYNYAMTEKEVNLMYVDKYLDMSDEERVAADLKELEGSLKEGELTKSHLELPDIGIHGSQIIWESSNTDVIALDGAVTRPALGKADEEVVLKAVVTRGAVSKTKTFRFTVLAINDMQGMEDFKLGTVDVTNSYYDQISQKDIDFLKTFDPDRLLSRFRETAGVDTKGKQPYTGWEDSYIGGHTLGHYLTACAQAYLSADRAEDRAWVADQLSVLISGLKECQDHVGTGFIFGSQIEDKNNIEKQFDIMEGKATGANWVPWYTMHKILAGLVDVYKYTDNDEALEVASNLGDWVYNRVSKWDETMKRRVLGIEYGGMNDCLYELYKYIGKAEHAKAAAQFDETWLFESVLAGTVNVLNGKHANTQIPKFVGALNRYRALDGQMLDGEKVDASIYLEYVEAFWDMVVEKHTYITGGNSEWEHFGADNILDAERTQCNCETCNTYNMLKMTRELYKITGDKKYADYYENTFINAIISSINPDTGMTTYFQPMATGYFKVYGNADVTKNQFWCCTGSGLENFTKLGDSIYYKKDQTLYVTQYLSSVVEWTEKNIKLTQTTSIPDTDTAGFQVNLLNGVQSAEMKLQLRVPDWIAGDPVVTVNGAVQDLAASGGYICIERTWADGDTVSIQLPMEVRAYGLPDDGSVYGFKYGPVVLSAELGTEEMDKFSGCGASVMLPGSKIVSGSQAMPKDGKRAVLGTETLSIEDTTVENFITHINDYLVRVDDGDSLKFQLRGTDQELTFSVHYRQHTQRYGIYWYFTGNDISLEEAEARILAQKEEGRTNQVKIDVTKAGYGQYEFDDLHQIWENGSVGTSSDNQLNGMTSRYAAADKDFSYRMSVNKEKDNYIVAKLAKIDNGKTLKITIEGQVIYNQVLDYAGEDEVYEVKIPIPDELVQKAQTVTVTEGDGNQKEYDVLRIFFSGKEGEPSARLVEEVYIATGYSNHAAIVSLETNVGNVTFDEETKTYSITVPEGTEKVGVTTKIADTYGLLYIDGRLVNDSVMQKLDVSDEVQSLIFKVYGEDHETVCEYTVKIQTEKEQLPFADVSSDDWYYREVVNVFEKGLMTGTSENIFSPEDVLLRAHFAMILYRMEDKPEVNDKNSFADVDDHTWYTDAVAWASAAGIITGYADKKFGPADRITREQMVTILYRYAVMKKYSVSESADLDQYEDAAKVSSFAEEAMQWAVGSGIIKGKFDETILDPQGDVTRAECAVVLTRFLEKFGEE